MNAWNTLARDPYGAALLLVCLAGMGACLASAPWRVLQMESRQHGWLGLVVMLALLWGLPARLANGMDLHLAGASLAALMFGARLGVSALAIVMAVTALTSRLAGADIALHGLSFVLVPALLSIGFLRLVERHLPRHVFIYIFLGAFAGTLIANACGTLVFVSLSALQEGPGRHHLPADFLAYRLLLAWGEAMLTGMLAASFLAFRPQWLMSFEDARYLKR